MDLPTDIPAAWRAAAWIAERHLAHDVDRAADGGQSACVVVAGRSDSGRSCMDIDGVCGADTELMLEKDTELIEALRNH